LQGTENSVPTDLSSNEQRTAALPATSQVPAPVTAGDAGQLPASYSPRPTSGQSRAAGALDLLFGGEAILLDDVQEVPSAGDHAPPSDAQHGLPSAGEDAAQLQQACDALFGGGSLTDKVYDFRAGAFNPAAAVAMMVGVAGLLGAHHGDRSPEPETR